MHEFLRLIGLVMGAAGFAACSYPPLGPLGGGDDVVDTTDHLIFGIADFKLAQRQIVRLHVLLAHPDGTTQDVTASAIYTSDDSTIAMIGGPGLVTGGSQAGTATLKASLGTATPAMVRATVTTTLCHPVINELATGSVEVPTDEWVELYNPCAIAIDVATWTLAYRSSNATGGQDSSLLVTLAGQMASSEFRLYAGLGFAGASDGAWGIGVGLGQTDGAVGLRAGPKDTGPLVDSVAYGAVAPANPFIETHPAPAMAGGKSASRLPFDGKDDDDNAADFMVISTPTPRALNVP